MGQQVAARLDTAALTSVDTREKKRILEVLARHFGRIVVGYSALNNVRQCNCYELRDMDISNTAVGEIAVELGTLGYPRVTSLGDIMVLLHLSRADIVEIANAGKDDNTDRTIVASAQVAGAMRALAARF